MFSWMYVLKMKLFGFLKYKLPICMVLTELLLLNIFEIYIEVRNCKKNQPVQKLHRFIMKVVAKYYVRPIITILI